MVKHQNADVIVVGGGVFGLSAAYHAQKAGLHVTVLEAAQIGAGASGGIVGALAPHTPDDWNEKKEFQLQALLSAADFWAEIEALSNLPSGYARTGRIVPLQTPRGRELAENRIKGAAQFWPSHHEWGVQNSHELINSPAAPHGIQTDSLSARLYPAKALKALASAFQIRGGEIKDTHPVTHVEPGRVSGPWGEIHAPTIILAHGVEAFEPLSRHLGQKAGDGVKGQAALLNADLKHAPVIQGDGVYIVPHINGTTAVGSTSETEFSDPTSTDEKLDILIAKAQSAIPALQNATILSRWAGLRPRAKRRNPLIGEVPDWPGILLATGGFKIGFGIAHHCGALLSNMIQGANVQPPQSFTTDWHLGPKP